MHIAHHVLRVTMSEFAITIRNPPGPLFKGGEFL
jgi:hypothetical protein